MVSMLNDDIPLPLLFSIKDGHGSSAFPSPSVFVAAFAVLEVGWYTGWQVWLPKCVLVAAGRGYILLVSMAEPAVQ